MGVGVGGREYVINSPAENFLLFKAAVQSTEPTKLCGCFLHSEKTAGPECEEEPWCSAGFSLSNCSGGFIFWGKSG